jgi:hypothetical protein
LSPYCLTVHQSGEGVTAPVSLSVIATLSRRAGEEDVNDGNATRVTSSPLPPLPLHGLDELIITPTRSETEASAGLGSRAQLVSPSAGLYGDGQGGAMGEDDEEEEEELGDSDTEDEDEVEGVLFSGGDRLMSRQQRRTSRARSGSESSISLSSDDDDDEESDDDEEYELNDDDSEEKENEEDEKKSDDDTREDSEDEAKAEE